MNNCATCVHWEQYGPKLGDCRAVSYDYGEDRKPDPMFRLSDPGGLLTHPDFGCKMHESALVKPKTPAKGPSFWCEACGCDHESILVFGGIPLVGCPKYPAGDPPMAVCFDVRGMESGGMLHEVRDH